MDPQITRREVVGLAGWILLVFVAAAIGSVAAVDAGSFYEQLAQPDWAPPGWVFGPVWTVLYTLMGISAWLIWMTGGFRTNRTALGLFVSQLVLNALWSWLFFTWHLGGWAFVDILALLLMLSLVLVLFWRIRPVAGILLIPYLLWVAFACVLNYRIWQLNPQLLGNLVT
jgi:translocator protein